METEKSSYGIKTGLSPSGRVCIQTSVAYLTEKEFDKWDRETKKLLQKNKD